MKYFLILAILGLFCNCMPQKPVPKTKAIPRPRRPIVEPDAYYYFKPQLTINYYEKISNKDA